MALQGDGNINEILTRCNNGSALTLGHNHKLAIGLSLKPQRDKNVRGNWNCNSALRLGAGVRQMCFERENVEVAARAALPPSTLLPLPHRLAREHIKLVTHDRGDDGSNPLGQGLDGAVEVASYDERQARTSSA